MCVQKWPWKLEFNLVYLVDMHENNLGKKVCDTERLVIFWKNFPEKTCMCKCGGLALGVAVVFENAFMCGV